MPCRMARAVAAPLSATVGNCRSGAGRLSWQGGKPGQLQKVKDAQTSLHRGKRIRLLALVIKRGPLDTNPTLDQAGNLWRRADRGAVRYSANAAPIIELGASRIGFDSLTEILRSGRL